MPDRLQHGPTTGMSPSRTVLEGHRESFGTQIKAEGQNFPCPRCRGSSNLASIVIPAVNQIQATGEHTSNQDSIFETTNIHA
jgi:methylphosphotriester-DNA--protein-cysteine methyltransferase